MRNLDFESAHMVKYDEDAYLPKQMSHFAFTEGPKNKIMRKSGIHSSVQCWDSTLEQFLFYRVSGKNAKCDIF